MVDRLKIKACSLGLLVFSLPFFLSGCSTSAYYFHGAKGQIDILLKREPISGLLAQADLDEHTRSKFELIQAVRQFSQQALLLPVGDAYASYSDLDRPYVIWNVYAAPELSLESYTWCYPIAGCFAYRGFFNEAWAKDEAEALRAKSFDVRVAGIVAYSTVGWFEDPVLNTFLLQSDVYLVDLLIHEIAHRKIYVKNDTMFNENFATAVASLGAEQWFRSKGQAKVYDLYLEEKRREKAIVSMLLDFKQELVEMFEKPSLSDELKKQQKTRLYEKMKARYSALKVERQWGNAYDNWVMSMNNATLATLSNYNELVPHFIALYKQQGQDWTRFYQEVERISRLDKALRHEALKQFVVK